MPKLSAVPRLPEPPGGYEPCPIDPDYERYYILDAEERPVRVYDYGIYCRWRSFEGKGYEISDLLPEFSAEVWTYFPGKASMHDDKPPTFWTHLKAGGINQVFYSSTWEEAQDKHARVLEKVKRVVPKRAG